MFNSTTEAAIRSIPPIAGVDMERLPQELTRIYALIVGLRRNFSEGTINYQSRELYDGTSLLQTLANNLETLLITHPRHPNKEAIAFVAGTAHGLLLKMGKSYMGDYKDFLQIDSIASAISGMVLFLIANSQPDAAEITRLIETPDNLVESSDVRGRLLQGIISLAKGDFHRFSDQNTSDLTFSENPYELAVELLWRNLYLGVKSIISNLTNQQQSQDNIDYFDVVIRLSFSDELHDSHRNIFNGPFHLAKLLKLLRRDILSRAIANIPAPSGVDATLWGDFITTLAKERPYLWNNHIQAINTGFLSPGTSAILTFPTGAGKSTLSELKIASCLFAGKKIIYLVPTHALEDQVAATLKKLFSNFIEKNIPLDGEYSSINLQNFDEIEVMTPERCLSLLNIYPRLFSNCGLVVFDEFHLIHGDDTGKNQRSLEAMLCLVTLLEKIPAADYMLISAMVENGKEVSEWIATITGRECKLFDSDWKPTRQLHGCLIYENDEIRALKANIKHTRQSVSNKTPPVQLKKNIVATPYCFFSLRNRWDSEKMIDYAKVKMLDTLMPLALGTNWNLTSNRNEVAARLAAHYSGQGLKTLVFAATPSYAQKICDRIEQLMNSTQIRFETFGQHNQSLLNSLQHELGDLKYSYLHNRQTCVSHHGLLLQAERILTEEYFKRSNGALALVATATLAQGINLPAEMVIIAGDNRYDEGAQGMQDIDPHELLNAAGRAGRAGMSSQGAVIIIPGNVVTIEESKLSQKWFDLQDAFSKSDQCLIVEDPLEYFLDRLQSGPGPLSRNDINTLHRMRSAKGNNEETKKILSRSFTSFRSNKENKTSDFEKKVKNLLNVKQTLDSAFDVLEWHQEISLKTGIDHRTIYHLAEEIEKQGVKKLATFEIEHFVDWFFKWFDEDPVRLSNIVQKEATMNYVYKLLDSKPELGVNALKGKLGKLAAMTKLYINGATLFEIEKIAKRIPENYLETARTFVLRIIPDLSFAFGLITMIISELVDPFDGDELLDLTTIGYLATCIREGMNSPAILSFKLLNKIRGRVDCHYKYVIG